MSHENAPATKLLGTNCACCGRALVDAVSVETGVGPDCREMHGYAEAQGAADFQAALAFLAPVQSTITAVMQSILNGDAHAAVNALVHLVAKRGCEIDRNDAACVFRAIAALGYTTLADRIAKRFHMVVTEQMDPAELARLRHEYARIRHDACYDNASPEEFDASVKAMLPTTPGQWVEAASVAMCSCKRCNGTGQYGRPSHTHECFRCGGKGQQDVSDARRNRAYDAHGARRTKAA